MSKATLIKNLMLERERQINKSKSYTKLLERDLTKAKKRLEIEQL